MNDMNRRTVLKAIGIGTAGALVGGAGVATAREGASGDDTIVDLAVANGFSVLVAAVQEAGLVDTLSGNRQLTVFAPTNDAFAAIGVDETNVDTVANLADILTYHVTSGRRYSPSVVNAKRIRTLNGADIEVDGLTLNPGPSEANIDPVLNDLEASNGVVHVIDAVLIPPS